MILLFHSAPAPGSSPLAGRLPGNGGESGPDALGRREKREREERRERVGTREGRMRLRDCETVRSETLRLRESERRERVNTRGEKLEEAGR